MRESTGSSSGWKTLPSNSPSRWPSSQLSCATQPLSSPLTSSFDGIGTLLHVLKELQIKVLLYVAVELDDEAFTTTAGQHGKPKNACLREDGQVFIFDFENCDVPPGT